MSDLRNDGSCARTRSAAHTRGDEYHIRVLECFGDLVLALDSGSLAYLGLCSCAETVGELRTDLYLLGSLGILERLYIGIDSDIINVSDYTLIGNAVEGVSAAAADTDNFDLGTLDGSLNIFISHVLHPPFTAFTLKTLNFLHRLSKNSRNIRYTIIISQKTAIVKSYKSAEINFGCKHNRTKYKTRPFMQFYHAPSP